MKPANNPYHTPASRTDLSAGVGAESTLGAIKHEVDDLVRLELTAEQMLGEEVDLAKAYISEDTHGLWQDMKLGLTELELITGDWLLRAADPTRVDWHEHHWWGDEESQLRH
ncbi:hypothetical protein [Cellvibrio sp. NN19]|uniref:hypothetical protein n=1 Tax=Cellvibrio chitinivorans TaxID=3102792 RepID=UPI002B416FCE|nr:hypothetical protein [Cellvibrio sp. NN19]